MNALIPSSELERPRADAGLAIGVMFEENSVPSTCGVWQLPPPTMPSIRHAALDRGLSTGTRRQSQQARVLAKAFGDI